MRSGKLSKNNHPAYVTINGNPPNSEGDFTNIAKKDDIKVYTTVDELRAVVGEANQIAFVDGGTEMPIILYVWDDTDKSWTKQQVESTLPTAIEVATLYESNEGVERYTTAEKEKLNGLTNFNTSSLDSQFDLKVDKIEGKQLSTEDFTTAEKEKLNGLEGPKFKGEFTSLGDLRLIVGTTGEYAYVDLGAGSTVEKYIWDTTDEDWIMQQGESNLLTPAQIKSQLISNDDTNVVTDSELLLIQEISEKQNISTESVLTLEDSELGLNLIDNTDYLIDGSVSVINISSASGSLSIQFTCGEGLEITLPENTGWGSSTLPIFISSKIYTMVLFRGTWYIDEGR